ncbi:GNAT family N-acetyltransferase [Chamaesiphon minutus]|uniref:Acetyltransferase, ribosomal protein N-acetylase n=1 Tax=Chamaesiphon minutus (strain ATCC 27169 / PCC 6605) TaxID=1173020 RepID=K9URD4_CHAP6|nr:GNAT family N-acetyltransferase [Chamaesiphon minutus]AFY97026.1 acetyltransferase, ribosomal protein N-acetylase [Chamaesiphon minutus PCC 6605]
MLPQSTLETTRSILRPLSLADVPSIQRVASRREVADTMISIPHPYPNGEAAQYLRRQIAEFEAGHSVSFAIERKSDRAFCGVIEIRDIETEHSQAELSFWLAVEMWGQGYMSEALKPILRFGFEDLDLNRLYAYHMNRNPGSGKVLQTNGFLPEGLLRQRVRKWGVFEDVKLWAILRRDWQSEMASQPS